ncbi:BspA family leucine-rich repeat surface protein [Psychrobacter sp. W2-37-MNA-CIBAN-0211]|uniref:BspA family leucine-rich repeat surface protein n=1 Tax=Psychrobacter sp. W2-37-MNA-CIBAN-0211 TaxID=3140443 RepID=UPI0033291FEA
MIESKTLGHAAGIQRQDIIDNSESTDLPASQNGVIMGRFKRGRMDKPFAVTVNNYKALLGDDPFSPSFTVVDDAFIAGAGTLMIMRVGSPLAFSQSATPPPTEPEKINRPATIAIIGTVQVGQTLSAEIADADGLPSNVNYRWLSNGDVIGASKDYLLTQENKGEQLSLRVTFTDRAGFDEVLTSETDVVQPFDHPASVFITGNTKVGSVLTAVISDANGVPSDVSYQWMADDVQVGTANTHQLTESDKYQRISLRVTFTDNDDFYENVTSDETDPVQPINSRASVNINGLTKVGQTLTSEIIDANGVPSNVAHQWKADGVQVGTNSSYKLTENEKSKRIALQVTFIDNDGFSEDITSVATSPVVAINSPASVSINGLAKVGQTLTSTVSDANGVPSNIAYKWMADGVQISTNSAYTLRENEKGKRISLQVTFADNDSFNESVTSSTTPAVQALNYPASVVINGDIKVGQTLNSTIRDTNGVPSNITYKWMADGVQVGTNSSYKLTESDKGKRMSLQVAFTDNDGFNESVTSSNTATVQPIDKSASVIINGLAKVGQTLTSTVSDANGVPSNVTYRWLADGLQLGSATSYKLNESDKGKYIYLRVIFNDNDGFREDLTSEPTVAVQALNYPASVSIVGLTKVGQTLTGSISDDNGVPSIITYKWMADGVQVGADSSYKLTDSDNTKRMSLQVTFIDNDNFYEDATSSTTAAVQALNKPASVTIIGVAKVGQRLTSTIADENGVPSNVVYKWMADGVQVSTNSTYTLVDSDAGKRMSLRVTFTDNDGYAEAVTSSTTELVDAGRPIQPPPVVLPANTPLRFRTTDDYYERELAVNIVLLSPSRNWAIYDENTGELLAKDGAEPATGVSYTGNVGSQYISIYLDRAGAISKNNSYRLEGDAGAIEVNYQRTGQANIPDGGVFIDSFSSSIDTYYFNVRSANLTVPSEFPSHITSAERMFAGSVFFNQNISGWNITNVTVLDKMFYQCKFFNQPIGDWDTSSVRFMNNTFSSASAFNQPLSNWDVSSVIDMTETFLFATLFNQPLGMWNVSKVKYMDSMFFNAWAFNQDLSQWCVIDIVSADSFTNGDPEEWTLPKPPWGTCPRGENVA